MLENLLNIDGVSVLKKEQLSEVVAGACSVFVRPANGTPYWSAQTYSVSYAQEAYATNGDSIFAGHGNPGYSVTGYCCASCNEYQNHPSWDGLFPTR